ncbi:SET domain-containing protein 4 isoform X2 [Haemaphysalis longicornis]
MPKKGRTHRKKVRRRSSSTLRDESVNVNLVKWMVANGFDQHTKLCLREFPETGRGIMTLQRLSAGHTILRIPTRLLITTETALSGTLHHFLTRHHKDLTPIEVLTVFLMSEKLRGCDSEWRFFIDSLPAAYTTPVFLGTKLLASLPDAVRRKADIQVSKIRSSFLKLQTQLGSCAVDDAKLLSLCENFSWKLFAWAWTAVNTRCIFFRHSSRRSLWEDDHCALAPFLDCLNHHWKADIQTAIVGSNFEIVTNNSYEPGDQVFISYGSHDNKKLFLEYGFVLADNPNDVVTITREHLCKLSSQKQNIPNFTSKLAFLEEKNIISIVSFSETSGFTTDGLTWNGKITVQVLSHPSASRADWSDLLFRPVEQELNGQQCQLVRALLKVMLCDYRHPLPASTDYCSHTVAAFVREETRILHKQLQLYAKGAFHCD